MPEKNISILSLDDILPNRFQPRIYFNDRQINELADSIKEHGVIQPIVVRMISDKYEIIAGERRYKASKLAGKVTIPAIIVALNDKESAELALIENVQRQNLTPIEESISYKKILDMGYLTQTELAVKLGKTQSTIANKLRLLNLDDDVQEALMASKISERHARSLLKLRKQNQKAMLDRIINERLTVRKTDEEIDKELTKESKGEIMNNNENNEVSNQFNIPTNPIINDQPKVNPGFMDIDKIETEAEDIFKEEKKPDLEQLLKDDSKPRESVMQTINSTNDLNKVEPKEATRRFFNMFADDIKEEKVTDEKTEEDIVAVDKPIDLSKIEVVDNNSKKEFEDFIAKKKSDEEKEKMLASRSNDIFGSLINEDASVSQRVSSNPFGNESEVFRLDDNEEFNTVEKAEIKHTADFQTVINTVERCTDTIRNSGFKVNLVKKEIDGAFQFVIEVEK